MATTELPGLAPRASRRVRVNSRAPGLARLSQFAHEKISEWARADSERLALWAPVAIGAGAAFYFGLKTEPALWAGVAVLLASGAAYAVIHSSRIRASAIFLIAVGFVAADLRATRVETPMLVREMRPTELIGRLVAVEEAVAARRLTIEVTSIDGLDQSLLPKRVRVSWRGAEFDVLPGDTIKLRAGLSPPPPPVAPGSFDFARQLYFQEIGAVGFAVTAPQILSPAPPTLMSRVSAGIERGRLSLARRIIDLAPGQGGAIVAAVVTGKRGAVSEASAAALRDSGLAHLLAISGLHMGLATGLIFFAVRFGLAVVEPIAIRFPIKKWAAAAALFSGFCYLILSGAGWSAQRAFIMSSIFFIAILADRRALSLRNVAIAATIILLLAPEAVLHPGFQMSFAAVTALIAAYEWSAGRADPNRSFAWHARVRRYAIGVAVTDLIASTATAPYSLYHFNRVAVLGLAANVIAVPIMGFLVMPVAILALILMPFGLDGWAWRVSAVGVDAILAAGGWVAAQSGAVATIAQWPPLALGVLTFGGLWLCLQKTLWRLGGVIVIPVAAAIVTMGSPPSFFVSSDGANAAALTHDRAGARTLALFNPRSNKFDARVWKEHVGLDRDTSLTLAFDNIGRCDPSGCVVEVDGATIAISSDPLRLAEDCARADLVVALFPARREASESCAAMLIDRRAAWEEGAHAVWIRNGKIRVRGVSDYRGKRPWTNKN